MRKLIAITQVSLDGVMQSPGAADEDPSNGFSLGGWAMPFVDEGVLKVIDETISGDFEMLLGRRTYEIFASYWPKHEDNPIGKAFNKATKHVVTSRPNELEWAGSQRIAGNVVGELRRLKDSEGPVLQVWGSGQLLQTLTAAGLVDEYQMWIFPVVLGKGKRMFEQSVPPAKLWLISSSSTSKGVLFNNYGSAGVPDHSQRSIASGE